jgi:hypothetical protein
MVFRTVKNPVANAACTVSPTAKKNDKLAPAEVRAAKRGTGSM